MSWDIIVRVLDEQTLHSRRSKMVWSSSSSSLSFISKQKEALNKNHLDPKKYIIKKILEEY
jgi:hypothetical protein